MNNKLSRREFCKSAALSTVATTGIVTSCSKNTGGKAEIPQRVLGKTGLEVSMLSFGGGSQFLENEDGLWEEMLEKAVQEGVNLFDTSVGYKWGSKLSSEEKYGQILPKYHKDIIISTKVEARDESGAMKEFEQSLKRLATD